MILSSNLWGRETEIERYGVDLFAPNNQIFDPDMFHLMDRKFFIECSGIVGQVQFGRLGGGY